MLTTRLWRRFVKSLGALHGGRRPLVRSRTGRRVRVAAEILESRQLLSMTVSLSGSSVTFTGDAADDSLVLTVGGAGLLTHNLPLSGNLVSAADLDSATAGEQTLAATAVTSLTIHAGDGNDVIDASVLSTPMTVRGGGGNDTMLTGSGNDYVEGGDGDDHIEVNAGDDRVYGDWEDVYYNPRIGTGHDTIQGGAGNDTLYGDSPAAGGTGNDVLDGGEGVDSLYGYGGDDVFRISSSAFTNVTGDAGFDRLHFLGRNLDLDLVNTAKVTGIEEIDVSGTGVNGLLLNQSRMVALSDSTDALIVRGNVDDSVWTSPGIVDAGVRVGKMPTSPEHDWDREEDVRAHQFREACDSVAIAPDRRTFTQHFEKQVLMMSTRNGQRVGEIICGWVCMRVCCGGGRSRHNLVEIRS